MEKKAYNRLVRTIRWSSMLGVLGLITVSASMHTLTGTVNHNVHTVCPFGGLESLYSLIQSGTLLRGIAYSSFVILAATVVVSIFLGRSFCGWICPLGTLQEIFNVIGKKIFKKKREIPRHIDRWLKYLKYVMLVFTIWVTWVYGELVIKSFDPWSSYLSILGLGGGGELIYVGIIILIALLLLSMVYNRFFCKYLCPLGAFLGIVSLISLVKIRRNENTCINCGVCNMVCPVGIDVMHQKTTGNAECIKCQLCTLSCPIKDTLEIRFSSKRKFKILTYGLVSIVLFFGVIFVSYTLGYFKTQQPKLSEIATSSKASPESIRGSATLTEISKAFSIPLDKLYKALNLDMKKVSPTTRLKDIKNKVSGFDVERVREAVKRLLEVH